MPTYTAGAEYKERQDAWPILPSRSFNIGIITKAKKGRAFEAIPKLSDRDWISEWGNPDIAYGNAAHSACFSLQLGTGLYTVRVHDEDVGVASNYVSSVTGGQVHSITVTDAGTDYLSATVAIAAAPTGGINATATATVVNGKISVVTITNPGKGYTSAPVVTFSASQGGGDLATGTAVLGGNLPTIAHPTGGKYTETYAEGIFYVKDVGTDPVVSTTTNIFTVFTDAMFVVRMKYATEQEVASMYIDKVDTTTKEFNIRVLIDGVLKETHRVSRVLDNINAGGQQNYIEDVINTMSKFIHIHDNTAVAATTMPGAIPSSQAVSLSGGDEGGEPSVADYANGLEVLTKASTNKWEPICDIILQGGIGPSATDETWASTLTAWAEANNSFAILGTPQITERNINAATAYGTHKATLMAAGLSGNRGSYCAVYSPHWYTTDPYNGGKRILLPYEGFAAQVYTAANGFAPWRIPAGTEVGRLPVTEPYRKLSESERDGIAEYGYNTYLSTKLKGHIMWDERTQHGDEAAFVSRVHVRLLYNYIKKVTNRRLTDMAFKFITQDNLDDFVSAVDAVFSRMQRNEAFYRYEIIGKLGVNNDALSLANREFNVDAYVWPTEGAEKLNFGIIGTSFGLRFDEKQLAQAIS